MNMKLMSKSCNKSTLQEEAVDCCALAGFEGELEELEPMMAMSSGGDTDWIWVGAFSPPDGPNLNAPPGATYTQYGVLPGGAYGIVSYVSAFGVYGQISRIDWGHTHYVSGHGDVYGHQHNYTYHHGSGGTSRTDNVTYH